LNGLLPRAAETPRCRDRWIAEKKDSIVRARDDPSTGRTRRGRHRTPDLPNSVRQNAELSEIHQPDCQRSCPCPKRERGTPWRYGGRSQRVLRGGILSAPNRVSTHPNTVFWQFFLAGVPLWTAHNNETQHVYLKRLTLFNASSVASPSAVRRTLQAAYLCSALVSA
jgi:hypothetical protein